MGKREKKIEILKKYIANAGGRYPGYAYGSIPGDRARGACDRYAGAIRPEDILGLIDISWFSDGTEGVVFTETSIYWKNGWLEDGGSITYQEMRERGEMPIDLLDINKYNANAMKEMVQMLVDTETNLFGEVLSFAADMALNYLEKRITEEQANNEKMVDQGLGEYGIANYEENDDDEEYVGDDDIILLFERFKETLSEVDQMLMATKDKINNIDCDSEEGREDAVAQMNYFLIIGAALLSNDIELHDMYLEKDSSFEENCEQINKLIDFFNDILLDDNNGQFESVDLKRAIKAFRASSIAVTDEIRGNGIEDVSFIISKGNDAIDRLHKVLRKSIRKINEVIEGYYNEE